MNNKIKECMDCKYFEQGATCSFCGHPEQTIESFKGYVYYNFGCDLHKEGTAQSRVEYMEKLKKSNTIITTQY